LLPQPHFSPEHLITPGAGALAVLQHHIRPRRRAARSPAVSPEVMDFEGSEQPGGSDAADLGSVLEPGQSGGPVAMLSASDSTLPGSLSEWQASVAQFSIRC
jgi:hypothetical protein